MPDETPELPETMQTRMVPIGNVKRYWKNPRRKQNVEKVARSLEEFGWRQPIVVDREMTIVVGDTRYLAAEHNSYSHVPVWVAADLDPAKIHAYRIADNRVADEAVFDDELLRGEMELLLELGVDDLTVTGFDDKEIEKLLAEDGSVHLEPVEVAPFPHYTWALVGIPTGRYIEIAEHIEAISLMPDVFVELTANEQKPPAKKV